MSRFPIAIGFVLLGALSGSPLAIAQTVPNEPTKPKPVEEPTGYQASDVVRSIPFNFYLPSGAQEQAVQFYGLNQIQTNPLETTFGLTLSDADDVLVKQLEIPDRAGVVVVTVNPGGLAQQAGLNANDIILSLGDTPAKGVDEVQKRLLGLTNEAIQVKLIREGKHRQLSLVGPEHGFPAGAGEYWIGVPVSPVDATLRSHLPFLAAETGLVVNDVVKDSPASQAGIEKGDVLFAMGGKPLKSSEELIRQIQATEGKPVVLEFIRAAKPLKRTVTPAKRAAQRSINYTISRDVQNQNAYQLAIPTRTVHYSTVYRALQPNVAVEVAPKATGDDPRAKAAHELKDAVKRFDPPQLLTARIAEPIHVQLRSVLNGENNPQTAQLEAQIKELSTKLDEIRTILDGLKKPDGK